ncbi:hypothetical protein pb186bvf_013544, partial [Paramecium bursaria]
MLGPLMAQERQDFSNFSSQYLYLEWTTRSSTRAFLQGIFIMFKSNSKQQDQEEIRIDKIVGYMHRIDKNICSNTVDTIIVQSIKKRYQRTIENITFQDKAELQNIFTNFSRILIDLPTMNLYFLKFLGPKCKEISQDSEVVCRGYQAHVISALTLSFDTHMVTLQLGVLFGSLDQLLSDLTTRCQRDLGNYESLKNFLKRDIVLMLDLMENPYYYYNILAFLKTNNPEFKQLEKSLLQRATISIIKLNGTNNCSFFFRLDQWIFCLFVGITR